MEIPKELKSLYKHWGKHTSIPNTTPKTKVDNKVLTEMIAFSNERMNIYEKRYLNQKPPYTKDPILSEFRFCNIYRELDKQTMAFHTLLKPLENDFALWLLNIAFCRFICNPETIKKIGLLTFNKEDNQKVYNKLLSLSSPKYGNAYIFPISVIQKTEFNTREKFFCLYLPKIIKEVAKRIQTFDNISVVVALKEILPIFGFNLKFHWTEILIDVAYQYPNYLNLFGEFPIGPGSIPTMKRLNSKEDPQKVCLNLVSEVPKDFEYLTFNGQTVFLSTENWEGIGCEFRKYTNLKNGEGRRRKYLQTS